MLRDTESFASGSFQFNADKTYSLSVVFSGNLVISLPDSCTSGLGCAGYAENIRAQIAAGIYQPNVTAISCSGASDCVCRQVLEIPQSETGTYSTSGNALTLLTTTDDVSNFSYCIEGSMVHLMTVVAGTTIDSDLVATKQ